MPMGVHRGETCLLQAVNLGLQVGHSLHTALAQALGGPPVALAPAQRCHCSALVSCLPPSPHDSDGSVVAYPRHASRRWRSLPRSTDQAHSLPGEGPAWSSLSTAGHQRRDAGASPALELLFVRQDVAAQAAGALGLVHVIQGRPAVHSQRASCALAADACLQAMGAESGDRMLAGSASLLARHECRFENSFTSLLRPLVCMPCMQTL